MNLGSIAMVTGDLPVLLQPGTGSLEPWAPWHTVIQGWRGCAFPSASQQRPWEDALEAGGRVRERGSCGTREPPEQDPASCASPLPSMSTAPLLLPAWLLLHGAHRPWGRLVMLLDTRESPLGKNTKPWAVLEFPQGVKPRPLYVSHPNQTYPVSCTLLWASTHSLLPGHSSS